MDKNYLKIKFFYVVTIEFRKCCQSKREYFGTFYLSKEIINVYLHKHKKRINK